MPRARVTYTLDVVRFGDKWELVIKIRSGHSLAIAYTLSIYLDRKSALAARDRVLEELARPF